MSVIVDGTSGVDTVQKAALVGKLPAGTVLQVVSATGTSVVSSTTNADIISASITPFSSSNKILVIGAFTSVLTYSTNCIMTAYLYRGTGSGTQLFKSYGGTIGVNNTIVPWSASVLDSPNTTSSQTYTLVGGKGSGGTVSWSTDSQTYTITLMEIAG